MAPEDPQSVWMIRQQCIFCGESIEDGQPRTAILMFDADDEIIQYQLDAHLRCVKGAAHPAMAERVDPTFFKRMDRRRPNR